MASCDLRLYNLLIRFRHLMTDPKSRKVIVTENTFLPTFVKDHIARVLFDNLQVGSDIIRMITPC